jgi:hypothetical protein
VAYGVNFSDEFEAWWSSLERDLRKAIAAYIGLLQEYGPQLGRPYADTLKGSRYRNMKELRIPYKGEPYRVLYAFDSKREALLLIGGNKASSKRWYQQTIPVAERIFAEHLKRLEEEDG